MICPRPSMLLLLAAAFPAIALPTPVARAADSHLLSSCSHCWPLSSVYPNSLMAPDGAGGTYVVWVDGSFRWRLQRLRADLTIPKPWPAAGLSLVREREARRIYPAVVADGSGGVYVSWAEQATNGDMSVWLLRVRPDGRPARGWPEDGLALSAPSPMALYPSLVRSRKGAAVAWLEARNSKAWIRLVARDANGRGLARWPADGFSLQTCECSLGDAILLASDDRAGLFLAWTEMQKFLSDLKVSYVSEPAATVRTWTAVSGAVPPRATLLDNHPEMVGDGFGGAIMVWADERSQNAGGPRDLTDTFGQRITASGNDAWTPAAPGNHPIAAGPGYQMNPHVVSDGRGGALLTWNEFGPFVAVSGRVQHLDSQGRVAPGWPASGVALGLEVASLTPDLNGGALAVWIDSTGSYLQHFESRWSPQAGVSAPLSLEPRRSNLRITSDGRGGAFMAWEERGDATAPGATELRVRIQHLSLESGAASPIVQLPTHDTPTIAFAVHPVAPNPARQSCRVAFDLPTADRVTIDVFDVAGRRIARLADRRPFEAGSQSVSWDLSDRHGRRVLAGLYLLRVEAGMNHAVVRVTIIG